MGSALAAVDRMIEDEGRQHQGTSVPRPSAATRRDLPAVIDTMEMACRPLDERAFAVAFVQFMETAIALGIARAGASKEEVAVQLGVYREAMGGLPGDLLLWAMRAVWKTWRWGTLPKPGDIHDLIREKVSRRRDALQKARWAKRHAERHGLAVGEAAATEATAESRPEPRTLSAETEALLADFRRSVRAAANAMPRLPAGVRENAKGELLVEPRPDLVARYARELGVMLPE